MSTDLSQASQLTDRELLAKVKVLAERERGAAVALIAHLAVLDERRLFLREGFSSMFSYCVNLLHLSESAACSRIGAARAAVKFPVILDMLADGSLNLTTLRMLVPELTRENHLELLKQARFKSTNEVKELVASLRPQPPVPASIRKLPQPRVESGPIMAVPTAGPTFRDTSAPPDTADGTTLLHLNGGTQEVGSAQRSAPARANVPAHASSPPAVTPLAPELYRVQFTVDVTTRGNLQLLQDLLRHQIPDGDIGKILELAIDSLLKSVSRRKLSFADHPRLSQPRGNDAHVAPSRHITAEVKRAVWSRDSGQCAFVAENGQRCPARGFLEFHHVVPYAMGGAATTDNIQLRCRAHNGYEAELLFGQHAAQPRHPPPDH